MRSFLRPCCALMYILSIIACNNGNNKAVKIATPKMESPLQTQPANAAPAGLVDTVASAVDTGFIQFAFVADNKYIILSDTTDRTWSTGAPWLQSNENIGGYGYKAISKVKTASLPVAYTSLLHKKFNVCGNNGKHYTATVSSFKIYAAIIPFSLQMLQGNEVQEGNEQPYSDQQQALDIFNKGARFLVAEFELDAQPGNTDNLYFAVPQSKRSPALLSLLSQEATNANKKRIMASLIKTTDYTKVQQEYIESPEKLGINWWQDKTADELFNSYLLNKKGFHIIGHYSGNECSSDFFGQRFSIWQTEENASPVLLFMTEAYYEVLLATDIDADGIPEFLIEDNRGTRTLLKSDKGNWTNYYQWSIPNQTCGC
ncbi:MAG TPA: hypothetical protein VF008_12285 [Niastella sp.]